MRISRVQVTVQPMYFSDDYVELLTEVTANGEEYNRRRVYRPDDLESMYDVLMQEAANHMKSVLKEIKQ